MSFLIPLRPVPNQELSTTLDGVRFILRFNALDEAMAVTITVGGEILLIGQRVVSGVPLIPYRYLESGNFIFVSDNTDIPFYTDFGLTQNLLYYTAEELRGLRVGA